MIEKIKRLREETQAPLSACKEALLKTNGDFEEAKKILEKELLVLENFEKEKKNNSFSAGLIDAYVHLNKKIGVLLSLGCETDFVAKNKNFQDLAHELCLQIASMRPKDIKDLLSQAWIKDQNKTISQLINETSSKLGEKISIIQFQRYEI
ncbi:MAG: elongation factor Ts [Minisyncoccales bacterium]